jgi:NAD-dependent deacetylase
VKRQWDNLMFPDGLIETLRKTRSVAVLTGAGISAESGLPTFRDAMTGLWAKFNPQELATPQAFRKNPKLVWDWYATRRERAKSAKPNPGHFALAEMEKHYPHFSLITQNIDSLHQAAGSQNVVELHGNISRVKCFDQNHLAETWEENGAEVPKCVTCGSLLRPDVVWFGEQLPEQAFESAVTAAYNCEVFFSIGTSGTVEPAASLARVAAQSGATVITINLEVDNIAAPPRFSFNAKAGELLPALVKAITRN